MIPRRQLVTGGMFGGALGALLGEGSVEASPVPAVVAEVSDETMGKVVQAIAALGIEVQSLRAFGEIEPVRTAQITYLKANGKFPDFVEVGINVWFAVHDWHVRWQYPMTIGRDLQGRNTVVLNQTTLIMRTDLVGSFIGLPYDNR